MKQDLIKNTPLRVCHPGLMIRLTSDNSPGISSTRSLLTPLELKHPLLHSTFANLFLVYLHILQCHVEYFWKFSAFSSLPGWSRDIVNWMVVSSYQHFAYKRSNSRESYQRRLTTHSVRPLSTKISRNTIIIIVNFDQDNTENAQVPWNSS